MVLLATTVSVYAFNVLQTFLPCYQSHYDGDCIDKHLAAVDDIYQRRIAHVSCRLATPLVPATE